MPRVPASVYALLLSLLITDFVLANKMRNVLILLADDGGFELGAYMNKICQTPHIDALARRSLRFTNAYVAVSSCSPSRAALLTGTASHQTGMYGLHHAEHHFNAFDNVTSLPRQLRENAVLTGIIGKKHVGPGDVFRFDVEHTEENNHINMVGRNITHIKLLVRAFLKRANDEKKRFLLYIGFHDPHRCGHSAPELGAFCERYGSGSGSMPDWTPWYYQWDEIQPPDYVPDTEPARRDLAAMYTAISRLDQGVGLVLGELEAAGQSGNTLVMYTSDNGPAFPGGRTTLYEPGVRVPLLLSQPDKARWGQVSDALVSLTDVAPTVRDWMEVPGDTAGSLLPILVTEYPPAPAPARDAIFLSHSHHEVTMYYPMRAVRTRRYKLIHNINFGMPFPIDQDLYVSATFQDILNRTRSRQPLPWTKTLKQYYFRPQWELYDLKADPDEMINLHGKPSLWAEERRLLSRLRAWQRQTRDPWRCAPHAVLWRTAHGDSCGALRNGMDLY